MLTPPPHSTLFPYTTLFRSDLQGPLGVPDELLLEASEVDVPVAVRGDGYEVRDRLPPRELVGVVLVGADEDHRAPLGRDRIGRSEEHTSELQSRRDLVCRLL